MDQVPFVDISVDTIWTRCFVDHECIHCACPPHSVFSYHLPCHKLVYVLLAPVLVVFRDLSSPLLILAPGKWLSRNTTRACPTFLVKSPVGNLSGSSMTPLCFTWIFLSVVSSGNLFMDSQKLLQLLTLACLTTHFYQRWASKYGFQCSGILWHRVMRSCLPVFFLSLLSSLIHSMFFPELFSLFPQNCTKNICIDIFFHQSFSILSFKLS